MISTNSYNSKKTTYLVADGFFKTQLVKNMKINHTKYHISCFVICDMQHLEGVQEGVTDGTNEETNSWFATSVKLVYFLSMNTGLSGTIQYTFSLHTVVKCAFRIKVFAIEKL